MTILSFKLLSPGVLSSFCHSSNCSRNHRSAASHSRSRRQRLVRLLVVVVVCHVLPCLFTILLLANRRGSHDFSETGNTTVAGRERARTSIRAVNTTEVKPKEVKTSEVKTMGVKTSRITSVTRIKTARINVRKLKSGTALAQARIRIDKNENDNQFSTMLHLRNSPADNLAFENPTAQSTHQQYQISELEASNSVRNGSENIRASNAIQGHELSTKLEQSAGRSVTCRSIVNANFVFLIDNTNICSDALKSESAIDEDDNAVDEVNNGEKSSMTSLRNFSSSARRPMSVDLLLVHSRVRSRDQRDAIRSTWGQAAWRRHHVTNNNNNNSTSLVIVFVLGRDRDHVIWDESVARENRLYGDIVVIDFIDTYSNLTYKSIAGLQWARSFCRSARYVIKTDDDSYVAVQSMLAVLERRMTSSSSTKILGSLNSRAAVQRRGLWRVDPAVYPASHFPPYCSGNLYAMTSPTVEALLCALNNGGNGTRTEAEGHWRPEFPLEDAYVTGLLAGSAGLLCENDVAFPLWSDGASADNIQRIRSGSLIALHNVYYTQMYALFKQLVAQTTHNKTIQNG